MNRMPPAVEMNVVVGPKAEGARRATGAFGPTTTSAATAPDPEVPAKAQRRRFTAAYRLRILKQADAGACAVRCWSVSCTPIIVGDTRSLTRRYT